jgi:hypothetical protein
VDDVLERLRVSDIEVARARDVHGAALDDLPGPVGHHVDGVGEEHRLAQVVRDQHHGHLARRLQVAQRAPKLLAREGVQRAERLVSIRIRLVDQRPADRGRCCMPPESSQETFRKRETDSGGRALHVCACTSGPDRKGRTISSGSSIFQALRHGSRLEFWKAIPPT